MAGTGMDSTRASPGGTRNTIKRWGTRACGKEAFRKEDV